MILLLIYYVNYKGDGILSKFKWTEITNIDVIKAIEKFEKENPEFPQAKSTFLIYNGKEYPVNILEGWHMKSIMVLK